MAKIEGYVLRNYTFMMNYVNLSRFKTLSEVIEYDTCLIIFQSEILLM